MVVDGDVCGFERGGCPDRLWCRSRVSQRGVNFLRLGNDNNQTLGAKNHLYSNPHTTSFRSSTKPTLHILVCQIARYRGAWGKNGHGVKMVT
jgi:hypothetical protein